MAGPQRVHSSYTGVAGLAGGLEHLMLSSAGHVRRTRALADRADAVARTLLYTGQRRTDPTVAELYLAAHRAGPPWVPFTASRLLELLGHLPEGWCSRGGLHLEPAEQVDRVALIGRTEQVLNEAARRGLLRRNGGQYALGPWSEAAADALNPFNVESETDQQRATRLALAAAAQARAQVAAAPQGDSQPQESEEHQRARRYPGQAWAEQQRAWCAPTYGSWMTSSGEGGGG